MELARPKIIEYWVLLDPSLPRHMPRRNHNGRPEVKPGKGIRQKPVPAVRVSLGVRGRLRARGLKPGVG